MANVLVTKMTGLGTGRFCATFKVITAVWPKIKVF